jgi:hypothetical protein
MIWELVKRDPASRFTLICLGLALVDASALPRHSIGISVWMIGMFWLQSEPRTRATELQAALPIGARDLFLARMVSLLAIAWLPLGVRAVLLLVRGAADDAAAMVEVCAGFSVLVLAAQSSRVREVAGSQLGTCRLLLSGLCGSLADVAGRIAGHGPGAMRGALRGVVREYLETAPAIF